MVIDIVEDLASLFDLAGVSLQSVASFDGCSPQALHARLHRGRLARHEAGRIVKAIIEILRFRLSECEAALASLADAPEYLPSAEEEA
jgi:hypothetical protein